MAVPVTCSIHQFLTAEQNCLNTRDKIVFLMFELLLVQQVTSCHITVIYSGLSTRLLNHTWCTVQGPDFQKILEKNRKFCVSFS